jgi:hypothetical protein
LKYEKLTAIIFRQIQVQEENPNTYRHSGPSIGKPSKNSLQLFFMVCYDIDTFRSFVTSAGFTDLYDPPVEENEKILAYDTALMLFGFRFLRQVLFGENSITLKKEAAEKRREQVQKMVEQIEREARERRAAEQDDMYGGQED